MSEELSCTLGAIHVHPVKSCAGIAVSEALMIETGLEFDRAWMVVDEHGAMLTQRELPRLALVRTTLRGDDMVLRASGMLALHIALDKVESATRARVWNDDVAAYDMGALAAQWFSDFLGRRVRLVRFDPEQRRLSSRQWTGDVEAENSFSDGFPILVLGTASLVELNRRLTAQGRTAITMERFRPNLVLEGLQPHDEDQLDTLEIDAEDGPVRLRLVKPCVRCSIPNIDPTTAESGSEPAATLAQYRGDPRLQGGITFGMNAVLLEGIDRTLRVGQRVRARWKF